MDGGMEQVVKQHDIVANEVLIDFILLPHLAKHHLN